MYPIEKYKYYATGNKVIAVSTYAGKTVRGVAKCNPEDTFDLEKGMRIAAARCAEKIAFKRLHRADHKLVEAIRAFQQAECHLDDMEVYAADAEEELYKVQARLKELLSE